MRHFIIVALLLTAGCLTKSNSGRDESASPSATEANYTGAIVYCRPGCVPCVALKSDLEYLQNETTWTVSADDDFSCHWLLRTDLTGRVPRIDYYENGQLIDTEYGYSTSKYWQVRKAILRELLDRHPG